MLLYININIIIRIQVIGVIKNIYEHSKKISKLYKVINFSLLCNPDGLHIWIQTLIMLYDTCSDFFTVLVITRKSDYGY